MSPASPTTDQRPSDHAASKHDRRDQVNAYDITNSNEWKAYTKYRPKYPDELFNLVYAFHEANGGSFDTAHDAGCGPGITAAILSRKFKHVICSDFSGQAVETARSNLTKPSSSTKIKDTELTFRQSGAEDMASWIEPNSVDLVTMSECLHWTDTAKTTVAVNQVLKPGGTLAAWYYSNAKFPDNEAVGQVFQDILEHWCELRSDFSEVSARTLWIENTAYDCIAIPESEGWAPGTRRIKLNTNRSEELWIRSKTRPWMRYEKQIGPNDVLEYVEDATEWEYHFDLDWFRGWFESLFPRIGDEYLSAQLKRMEEALGGPSKTTRAIWPLSMILARKKREGE